MSPAVYRPIPRWRAVGWLIGRASIRIRREVDKTSAPRQPIESILQLEESSLDHLGDSHRGLGVEAETFGVAQEQREGFSGSMPDVVIEGLNQPIDGVDSLVDLRDHRADLPHVAMELPTTTTEEPPCDRSDSSHETRLVARAPVGQATRRRLTRSRMQSSTIRHPSRIALTRLPVTELLPTRAWYRTGI